MDQSESPFAEPPAQPVPRRLVAPVRKPSLLTSINWDDLRVKAWQAGLIVASAYAASHLEKWGWLAPVLTASAGMSKAPVSKSAS